MSASAPYGAWLSPITSASTTATAVNLDEIRSHATGMYWIERRTSENGRGVIVRYNLDETEDILPAPFNARSRVHEYGGGAYCVADDGLFFVNDADQNIYFYDLKTLPHALTHNEDCQYADLTIDTHRQQLFCICQQATGGEDINSIIAINLTTGDATTLCSGYDFYSNPRLSPCGKHLSWICWNHPSMPWDGTELWRADLDSNSILSNSKLIDGGDTISIFQCEWSPSGVLTYVSDKTGWWNLYQYRSGHVNQLTDEHAEFGLPQWVFCQSSYAFINADQILCAPINNGVATLSVLNLQTNELESLTTQWNNFSSLQSKDGELWFIASSSKSFPEIICLTLSSHEHQTIRSSNTLSLDASYYSYGKIIEFPTRHNDTAFAVYYAPCNKDITPNQDELPPLIVLTHGGPTSMTTPSLDIRKQFWTSRGFAVLDVNYSGSTGFGRQYRKRLEAQWGIRDVDDCCDAALYMVKLGLADPERLIIKGNSAGGYTVLCALTFHNVFSAGASYYGIGDLESLVTDTHKFESHYLNNLVGPYPDTKKRYHERSPLHHVNQLNCPVIFFQGIEDKVVPKEQAEKMFNALKQKGLAVAYITFEGEQHGFRQASTLQKTLDVELYFYHRIFKLSDDNPALITIENLTAN